MMTNAERRFWDGDIACVMELKNSYVIADRIVI